MVASVTWTWCRAGVSFKATVVKRKAEEGQPPEPARFGVTPTDPVDLKMMDPV